MGQESGTAHVDAQHIRALAAAAHSVKAAAQLSPAQQAEEERNNQQRNDDAHLHIGRDVLAQLIGGAKAGDNDAGLLHRQEALVGHTHRLFADDGRHALGKEHTRQGDNKGLDAQVRHQEALDHAKSQADTQTDENDRQDTAALLLQVHRAGHTHQAGDCAHADVDAAGNHHQAHAASQNNEGGVIVEDIQKILGFGEAAAQEKDGGQIQDEEDHNGDGQQQVGVAHGGAFLDPPLLVNCNSFRHFTTPPLRLWQAIF